MPQAASLKSYLPDDASWGKYNVDALKGQCEKRKLLSVGTKKELIRRLAHYRDTHPGEKRREPWVPKPPPDYAGYRPQDPATCSRDSAPPILEPIAPAASAAPPAVEAPVSPTLVSAPGPDVPAGPSAAFSPATVSASISGNTEKRKVTKLARKLKSLAKESAYVREHADRELKRLAKKSKRLEKQTKALAKRNKADCEEGGWCG